MPVSSTTTPSAAHADGLTPSGSAAVVAAPHGLSEESAIVLDKWLYDVCGEEQMQFPSHRRQQFPAYVERLRRVVKTKQFLANSFDYPSRSGTREVLVLQKTLEALASREQGAIQEVQQVQDQLRQVQQMLEERTMGASTIVATETALAAREAVVAAEKLKRTTTAPYSSEVGLPRARPTPERSGYVPLGSDAGSTASAAPPPGGTSDSDAPAKGESFSATARAIRRTEYEKKRALSRRYVADLTTKTEEAAKQRVEMQQRHARLLLEKEQLDKEYAALKTTEELVMSRHEEAESHRNEEALLLDTETAAFAAEEAAFYSVWDEGLAMMGSPSTDAHCEDVIALAHSGDEKDVAERGSAPIGTPPLASPLRFSTGSSENGMASDGATPLGAAAPPVTELGEPALDQPTVAAEAPTTPSSASTSTGEVEPLTVAPVPCVSEPQAAASLEVLRQRLSEMGTLAQTYRRHLLNESQTHQGRFRQSQQRLKDWQDMVGQLQLTHHQLRGQVDVIFTVVSDTANRLEEHDGTEAGAQPPSGYREQLARLNMVLKERSYETLQYYVGSGEEAAVNKSLDTEAEEKLRALQCPAPGAADITPLRGGSSSLSSSASSATPSRQSSVARAPLHHNADGEGGSNGARTFDPNSTPERGGGRGHGSSYVSGGVANRAGADKTPLRHRSRYELVRHLQRWEGALLEERLAVLKAAHMIPGPYHGAGANTKQTGNFDAASVYRDLRTLLLTTKEK